MDLLDMLFLVVVFTLWVYLLFVERQTVSKIPLWVRYAATTLALAALVGLLFPISVAIGPRAEPDTTGLAVFTTGTPATTLRASNPATKRVTTDSAIARRHHLPLIHDWPSFSETHRRMPISIHGYGLTENQLNQLSSNKLSYHRPPLPQGIIACEWPMQLHSTSALTVRGTYHHVGAQPVRLVLLSASLAVDSTTIDAPGTHLFTLHHRPSQQGNTVFELVAISGTDTIQTEKVPVSIAPAQTLRIFMLTAAPSFEHKFLTNWFEGLHYQVAGRTRISQDRFSVKTNAGMGLSTVPEPLSRSTFSDTDLLIADEAEMTALSRREQELILDAIAGGMGLVLLKSADGRQSLPGRSFQVLEARNTMGRPTTITEADNIAFPELLLPAIIPIRDDASQRPLLRIDGHTIAATRLYGNGRITATTLSGTYSWWLKGEQSAYSRCWSLLIDQTLVNTKPPLRYVQTPRFPTPFSWIQLALSAAPLSVLIDGQPYPALQHEYLTAFNEVSLWLPRAGWHTIQAQPAADTTSFYVYGTGSWQAARNYATMSLNESFTKAHSTRPADPATGRADAPKKELPKWPYIVVFFVSATVLWYASRDYNQNVM